MPGLGLTLIKSTTMQPPAPSLVATYGYPLETLLKLLFLPLSLFNLPYSLLVAAITSIIGVIRIQKNPQFSKEYLQRFLLNNHGQTLLYIAMGSMGYINYLFYAPIALYFAYGIVQFVNLKYKGSRVQGYIDIVRYNKSYIFVCRAKLQIFLFVYMLCTLPIDFLARLLKVFLLGQFLLIKWKLSPESRSAAASINDWIETKTSSIGIVNTLYKKVIGYVYTYATAAQ